MGTNLSSLTGRQVMVGSRLATIASYNQFNRPPFVFDYEDGEQEFGWRETFYLIPTQFEIAAALHGEKHGDGCTFNNPANCERWHESLREANVVLDLLRGES